MTPTVPHPTFAGAFLSEVGLIHHPADDLASWFASDGRSEVSHPSWGSVADAASALPIGDGRDLTKRAFVPMGSWTLLLTDGPSGTDVGVIPSHTARRFGATSVRAVWATGTYPAVIFEVFDSTADPVLGHRRSVVAANDGGRWVFEESGAPFDFEETARYRERLKRKRFTGAMLHTYLRALGVPLETEPNWGAVALLTGRPGRP